MSHELVQVAWTLMLRIGLDDIHFPEIITIDLRSADPLETAVNFHHKQRREDKKKKNGRSLLVHEFFY